MTVVMRNGASFELPTILNRRTPYFLTQDATTHPAWTGERSLLSVEDERVHRLLKRFESFGLATEEKESKQ